MGYNCELKTKENSNERNTQLLTQECFERTVCRLGEYAKDIPGNVFLGETNSWGVTDALYRFVFLSAYYIVPTSDAKR